jgi:hydrogenase maturation protease
MTKRSTGGDTLILGLGNIIMGDEGFGVQVAKRLAERPLPDGIRVETGGVGGFDLLATLEGAARVIVVDVMMAETAPGEVLFFKSESGPAEPGKHIISFHQVGVPELVQMWRLLGHETEVCFLVTRPERLEWGAGLSEPVEAAVEKAVAVLEGMIAGGFG